MTKSETKEIKILERYLAAGMLDTAARGASGLPGLPGQPGLLLILAARSH